MPRNSLTEVFDRADLTASERHRLLAADRRRLALVVLVERTAPVELDELAADVAAREAESIATDDETIEHVAIELHHAHLPKLASAGVLEYSPETNLIESIET